jgi:glycine betaine/choline ABC-type transport system substrate-binding protein
MLKLLLTGSCLFAACALVGCGPPAKAKAKVSGEVLLDGKPMPEGSIMFVMTGEVPETLPVTNGTFTGEVSTGEKRVEIRAYREGKIAPTATIKEAPKENYIPAKYNSASTLKAKVTSSGIEPSKFEVTSQ